MWSVTLNKTDKARERDLFHRLVDGRLTLEEFSEFEARLQSDAGFRERYIRAIDIEAGLYEAFNFPGTFPASTARENPSIRYRTITVSFATVVLGCIGWFFLSFLTPHRNAARDEVLPVAQKPVAIVTLIDHVADSSPEHLHRGMRIKPGLLRLAIGQLQLEFLNGAQINLEGPATLNILSVDAATLISGKAAARVPTGARGFVLNTPGAAIVDMGTEFAVSIGEHGESEVHVLEGAVDVSLLGRDGNTLTSRKVTEARTVRVNQNPAGLEKIAAPNVSLPGIQSQVSPPLRVADAYRESIRESNPIIYWCFETISDGRVPNEMGPQWSAVIHASPDDPSAIVVRDGAVRFTPSKKPHRLEPDGAIPALNRESFTFEFWVSPDSFHWATLISVVPDEIVPRNLHMSLIELPYKCSLVYPPGSFRFLVRHPPTTNGGTNLFTEGDCTPGLWHHLVAIKTPDGMKLYLNGELARQFAEPAGSDNEAYRFFVGQLYEGLIDRQLSGAIDEVAVYLRPLTDKEIAEHFRAMIANQPPRL